MIDLILETPNTLLVDTVKYECASGRGGIKADKVEGDGATPIGTFNFTTIFYRSDRLTLPPCKLPTIAMQKDDGWCDAPEDPNYNQLVKLPYAASHEEMWRDDELYDIVVVIDYNLNPIVPGKGSAIFMHLARKDYESTAGCIALKRDDLMKIIPQITPDTKLIVRP